MSNAAADAYALGFQAGEKAERERCAKLVEEFNPNLDDSRRNQDQLAALIRKQ